MKMNTTERQGMRWLAVRLKEIRRRPVELATHLGIAPPRVYEMLGGRRRLQQHEMAATAEFLEWPLQTVADLVSGNPGDKVTPLSYGHVTELPRNIPIREARLLDGKDAKREFALSTTIVDYARRFARLTGRADVFGVQMQDDDMSPWREIGQTVLFEQNRPAREGDHALIEMVKPVKQDDGSGPMSRAAIKKIVKLSDSSVRVKHYNPPHEFTVQRADIKHIYRVLEWEELIS